MQRNIENRTLFVLDNLHVLRGLDTGSIDLIATDPPFNSRRIFNAPLGSRAAGAKFADRWRWDDVTDEWHDLLATEHAGVKELIEAAAVIEGGGGDRETGRIETGPATNSIAAYLAYMAPRLVEMRRVLKPTGSLYLHCDDAADSYLRLLLDAVFGRAAFRNAITWKRQSSNNAATGRCGRITDTILFYAGDGATWNDDVRHALKDKELKRYRRDARGMYKADDLTAPDSTRRFEWRGTTPKAPRGWAHSREQLEAWWAEGRIIRKQDGAPRLDGLKRYVDPATAGQKLQNLWIDIERVTNTGRERTGWPTQKPVALYERIVRASTRPGDVVLDPFAGCSTTLVAAENLGRRWIGIDIDPRAHEVVTDRLESLIEIARRPEPARRSAPSRTDVKAMPDAKLRELLWQGQGRRCANPYCDAGEIRRADVELDHRIPRSRGGADDRGNRIGLCGDCNRRKGRQAWGVFLDAERAKQPHPSV